MRLVLAALFMTALVVDFGGRAVAPVAASAPGVYAGAPTPAARIGPPVATNALSSAGLIAMADSVEKDVAMLRGWPFKHPVEKAMRTPEELRAFILAELDREFPDDRARRTEAFLRTVGLLPDTVSLEGTMVDVLMNQVAGFYDPRSRGFYMVSLEGMHLPPAMVRILIAHELTHALDDQYVSLDSLLQAADDSEDAQFAMASVVEGSATELMTRYMARMQMTGQLTAAELGDLIKGEMERSRPFMESPPYFASIAARYTCGMSFLLRGDMMKLMKVDGDCGVGEALPGVWARMPSSSEQILHPEKYWDEATRDEPVVVDDEAIERVAGAAGADVAHANTVGEALCAVLARPAGERVNMLTAGTSEAWTSAAAKGWGGDRFYLLERVGAPASGRGAAAPGSAAPRATKPRGLWITVWDTPADRDEFVAAYAPVAESRGAVAVLLGERSAAYVYGFDGDLGRMAVDTLIADLQAVSPPLSQAGKPVGW